MKKRWVSKPVPSKEIIDRISQEFKENNHAISDKILYLMAQRNISNLREAIHFFNPDLKQLHDPFLMKDMEKAVKRIDTAIQREEKILIYGDYDVDGTTAVALVYSFFKKIYPNIGFYIPDRFKEGYGISITAIDYASAEGYSLIVALDCGIKSFEAIAHASTLDIDFIVCDHHNTGAEVPKAHAILNPKQLDCSYPFKELSGCGIGFKLTQAYAIYDSMPYNEAEYLDLVAIAIASDIVSLTGENRVLAHFGLNEINSNPRPGIKALIELSGSTKNLTITDLVFRLGPRINAAGRIASGKNAVEMLIAPDAESAKEIASLINSNNTERQGYDASITTEAMQMIEDNPAWKDAKSSVLFNPEWHKGVIGIVASRVIDKFYRPTIMLTESNGMAVGSARSVNGFNLYNAIAECTEYLEQWGGHHAAAGLMMKVENVDAFRQKFEEVVSRTIQPEMLSPMIEYDMELSFENITEKFTKTLERFGPFGPDNMCPYFITKKVKASSIRLLKGVHLQMQVKNGSSNTFKAIAFNQGDFYKYAQSGALIDICYHLELSEWNNQTYVNINIKDIHTSSPD